MATVESRGNRIRLAAAARDELREVLGLERVTGKGTRQKCVVRCTYNGATADVTFTVWGHGKSAAEGTISSLSRLPLPDGAMHEGTKLKMKWSWTSAKPTCLEIASIDF